MKRHSKKYLSLLLTVVMLLTVLPLNVFADQAGDFQNYNGPAKAEWERGTTTKIEKTDVTLSGNVSDFIEVESVNFNLDEGDSAGLSEQKGKVTIKYTGGDPAPDQKTKEIELTVTVKGEADTYTGTAKGEAVQGEDFKTGNLKFDPELPAGATFDKTKTIDTDTIEDVTGKVLVTFQDKSTKDVAFTVTVTAPEYVTITFKNSNLDPAKIKKGSTLDWDSYQPTKAGYKFDGWYLDADLKTPVPKTQKFDKDTTIYAKWEEVCKAYVRNVSIYRNRIEGEATPGARVALYNSRGSGLIADARANSRGYFTIYTDYFQYYRYYDDWYREYRYRTGYLQATKSGCENSDWYTVTDDYYYYGDIYWDKEYRIYPTNIKRTNYSVSGDTKYGNTRVSVYDGNTYLGSTWTDRSGYFHLSWNSPSVPTGRSLQYYIGDRLATATAPVIKEAIPQTKIVKGSAGKYASITVRDHNDKFLGSTTADKDGNFTVYLNRGLKPGERIKVIAEESTKKENTTTYTVASFVPKATVTHKAYIAGYPDGSFRPQGNVTRAEAAQMFGTLLNGSSNFGTSSQTKFSDANNSWYSPAVNYIVGKGLISGYEDGTFRPNTNITRAEFAQMISGYIQKGYPGKGQFKDVKGHWASDAIDKVYGNKYVAGYPDGTFQPNREITRAEAVTILNAVFGRSTNQKSLNNINTSSLKKFTDVNANFWAYYEILDASNNHNSFKLSDVDQTDVWK